MNTPPNTDLRTIHRQLHESALIFHVLAERSSQKELRALFQQLEASRGPMVRALSHEVAQDGQEMPSAGTLGGIVDRIWLRVRDTIAHPDPRHLLSESALAEEHLRDHYRSALDDAAIAPHVKELLAGQLRGIEANIADLRRAGDLFG